MIWPPTWTSSKTSVRPSSPASPIVLIGGFAPPTCGIPNPVEHDYIYGGEGYDRSYIEYLMTPHKEPGESYTYGERLTRVPLTGDKLDWWQEDNREIIDRRPVDGKMLFEEGRMSDGLRRLRGLLGVGVTWGALWAVIGGVVGVVLGVISPELWTLENPILGWAFGMGLYAYVLRWVASGRAPLSNGHESLLFIALAVALAGLIFELIYRMGVPAALGGILTVLIRNIGMYADGVVFAILLINTASPLLDKIRPRAIGKVA